jgi:intracellular septation protein
MPAMKFLFDLFPIILFFVTFKLTDIFVATAVAVAATVIQVGYLLLRRRKVDPALWVSLAVIGFFGSATLLFHDQTFIKWKPTVLYWIFAVALAGAQALFKRNLLRSLIGQQVELPESAWSSLIWAWSGFFAAMGVLNLFVAYHFSTEAWVNFKVFGGIGLMFLFVLAQGFYLARHSPQKDS